MFLLRHLFLLGGDWGEVTFTEEEEKGGGRGWYSSNEFSRDWGTREHLQDTHSAEWIHRKSLSKETAFSRHFLPVTETERLLSTQQALSHNRDIMGP